MGAQASPNVGLLIYQNAFPPHNKNVGKALVKNPTTKNAKKPNNVPTKQCDNHNKSHNYTLTYLDYSNLIGCISQIEPSINVINIKGLDN